MDERDVYLLKRRTGNIKLIDIAQYIGCDLSLISKYERKTANMMPEKVSLYKKYIDEKLGRRSA